MSAWKIPKAMAKHVQHVSSGRSSGVRWDEGKEKCVWSQLKASISIVLKMSYVTPAGQQHMCRTAE